MVIDREDVLTIIICFQTFGWTQNCLSSFRRQFPTQDVLVLDNNPLLGQFFTTNAHYLEVRRSWNELCDLEVEWAKSNGFEVVSVSRPGECKSPWPHGKIIDIGFNLAHERGYKALLHIEPDCTFSGTRWFEEMLSSLNSGKWMSGSIKLDWGPIHICPSMWNIEKIKELDFTFDTYPRSEDETEVFAGVDLEKVYKQIPSYRRRWDTGMKLWYECAKRNKCSKVSQQGMLHHWNGSKKDHLDRISHYGKLFL